MTTKLSFAKTPARKQRGPAFYVGAFAAAILAVGTIGACGSLTDSDSRVVNENMTKDADNFKIDRRVTAINLYTDAVLFTVEGKCSINDQGNQLEILCKIGDDKYTKTMVGIPTEGVGYVSEQMNPIESDPYHYKLNLKPEVLVPDIELNTSANN